MYNGKFMIALLAIGFALVNGTDAFAQRKIISEKEYLAAMQKPGTYPLRLGRSVGLVELMSNGVVIESETTMQESIPPNRVRRVVKVTKGNKSTEIEHIYIGSKHYQREDGGSWHDLRTPPPPWEGVYEKNADPYLSKCKQYSVESGSLDGKPMQIYELWAVDDVEGELFFLQWREWIGVDVYHYRTEKVEGKLFPREERTRSYTTYTHNPTDLKIEAPIK